MMIKIFELRILVSLLFCFFCCIMHKNVIAKPFFYETQLFTGSNIYSYRIPGIIETDSGTLVAYCEKRKGVSDWADISIVCKRSNDNGKTWSKEILIADGHKTNHTINNPVMIADGKKIHLLYEVEYGLISKGGGIFYSYTEDEGVSWHKPKRILEQHSEFNVFATGPGHGFKSSAGRLIIPVWMVLKSELQNEKSHHPGSVSTLYSDDHGVHWKLGEIVPSGKVVDPNESTILELTNGNFILNIRNESREKLRAVSYSKTGIDGWKSMSFDNDLPDPTCFGSLARYDKNTIMFINCNSKIKRENLTICVSGNEGKSWEIKKIVSQQGGYADIIAGKKNIYVLLERVSKKNKTIFYSIYFNKCNLKWLKENKE